MSLFWRSLDQLTEADLANLQSTGVPEGPQLDYKRDAYGSNDDQVREFLKDVSSFANTSGGHLIIGVDEVAGVPTALTPISSIDPDKELQRLENLARDGLEPRILGLGMRHIPAPNGGGYFVIKVPASWNLPHRVRVRNVNRIYARNSGGAYEVSMDELQILFTRSASALEKAKAFKEERLAHIRQGGDIAKLDVSEGVIVVHLIPLTVGTSKQIVDLKRARETPGLLCPLGATDFSPRLNFNGFACFRGDDGKYGYTQLFRDGAIEAVRCPLLGQIALERGVRSIPSHDFEKYVIQALKRLFDLLQRLDVPPPIVLAVSLDRVQGAYLTVSPDHPSPVIRVYSARAS